MRAACKKYLLNMKNVLRKYFLFTRQSHINTRKKQNIIKKQQTHCILSFSLLLL